MINKILAFLRRDVGKNITGIFIIKLASMGISFFSMPLYMKYFGNDSVLGAWYTILSIVNWIYIFDFGMGNSLRNKLVFSLTQKDYDEGREYVETSYTMVLLIGMIMTLSACIVISCADLNAFFNLSASEISPGVLKKTVLVLTVGVILCFSLKTINAVLFAFQKAMFTSLSTLVTSASMLLFILFYPSSGNMETAFFALGIAHAVAIVFPLFVTTIIVFSLGEGRKIRPHGLRIKGGRHKDLLSLGIGFFAIQILSLLVISTNEIMIARFFGSEDVVEYSIYHKVFNLASSIVVLAVSPIWSKITQYISKKDFRSVANVYKRLILVDGIACGLIFAMVPLLQIGFNLWLGKRAITVNYAYAFLFAFYTGCYITSIVLTTVANGSGRLKPQLIYYIVAAVSKIPVTLLLSGIWNSWITVLTAVSVPMFMFCIVQHISNRTYIVQQSSD